MAERMSFAGLLSFYERHLTEDIMPFWLEHCIDEEHGGINNIVGDDGTVLSTDRFLWSQGRGLWTFSSLFNDYDSDPKWLEIARGLADFILRHGRDADGNWVFKLHRDGSVAEPPKSIYVDAFVAYGLTHYAMATSDSGAIEVAVEIYRKTTSLLEDHASLPTEPHRIPAGHQSHGPSMIFALIYHELGLLTGNREMLDRALELAEIIMTQHVKPERRILFEYVKPGGELADTDAGKTFLPGHAVESMWFLERIYRYHEREDRIRLAMDVIRWSLESGWDEEYGGLYLACHAEGGEAAWHQPDAKVWWTSTEALLALLVAYEVTREDWCMEWYWKVHDYSFRVFPDTAHGEWHQNLDRRGNVTGVVVRGLQVKDPFHLPRSLIYGIQVLRRLTGTIR